MRKTLQLKVDVHLDETQRFIWYKLVATVLGLDDPNVEQHEYEYEDDEFSQCYMVYLDEQPNVKVVEAIVHLWGKIYPRDFNIELSVDEKSGLDEEIEFEDGVHEDIQKRASRFFHNRWVENQIQDGWRYGMHLNEDEKTDPRLINWDSLQIPYRKQLVMNPKEAYDFLKKYPYVFRT